MSDQGSSGGVSYKEVGADYFEKRGLKRYAKVWSLWALGVGAVISGHYSGWNFGLANGFGSMLVALFIIAAMYWGLIFSLAEMSPALPHTGAAYSFARSAMGPWGGMFTGLAESIEYILTPAVIVFFIGSYLGTIFGTGPEFQPLWWFGAYILFLLLNLLGVELSFRVSVGVTVAALLILAVFWVSALPNIDFNHWALNIGVGEDGKAMELADGGGSWFPFGLKGVLATLPFAVWLFLAIEQLPLAAEESADPKKDMPKGLILGMLTLMCSALLITFLNASIGKADGMHGSFSLSTSTEPLLDGFRVMYGTGAAKTLAFLAVIGLIASFHTIIYAYGRQIYSLARAGYYLPFMSLTNAKKTPHMALYAGSVLGFATMLILWFAVKGDATKSNAVIGGTLLNMAVFGAMISYAMQGLSFIVLRNKMPNIIRPYRSPVGVPGAVVTIVVALVTLWYQLQDPVYRGAVLYVAGFYVLGILYFALYGRNQLILSPEEEFALSKGEKAHG
ncbi:MAG TPA: amino acid permease [Steroidobacteraceae bacterium]|jgi:ethanolamine permease|nr:amino acid permease [Steroidobacteraceae bacterium]